MKTSRKRLKYLSLQLCLFCKAISRKINVKPKVLPELNSGSLTELLLCNIGQALYSLTGVKG